MSFDRLKKWIQLSTNCRQLSVSANAQIEICEAGSMGGATMITCRCPQCHTTFRHEDAETERIPAPKAQEAKP